MEAIAKAGYVVLAPNHRDAACGGSGSRSARPEAAFREPNAWSAATYEDRRDDVRRLVDTAKRDPALG